MLPLQRMKWPSNGAKWNTFGPEFRFKPNLECKLGGVLNQLKALNGRGEYLLSVWNGKESVLEGWDGVQPGPPGSKGRSGDTRVKNKGTAGGGI